MADYLELIDVGKPIRGMRDISLFALANMGTIIWPVAMDSYQKEKSRQESIKRRKLLEDAQNGDEEAMESLTMDDIDIYAMLSRRVMNEDILSIVDTCFMPYGIESDVYYIIGNILDVRLTINTRTSEKIYLMRISCNDIIFPLAVNAATLTGEPMVGMRFKGSIWLQGKIRIR